MSNLEKRIFARAMQTWAEHMITLSEGNVEMLTKLTKSMSTIIKSLEKPKGIAGVLDNIGYRLPEDKKGKFTMLVIILIPTVGYFFLRLVAAYEKVFVLTLWYFWRSTFDTCASSLFDTSVTSRGTPKGGLMTVKEM
uniref:Uncharacterized protein n=1 Tax=Oryza sativa subsp. japonica TaxID=39947 RepID=Q8H5V2_ORYSJ|nr:hypothetical protein [Oryza sativa Japonica Group]